MIATPCDWDGESYCVHHGCTSPATHPRLTGMVEDRPTYELVCCHHAPAPGP